MLLLLCLVVGISALCGCGSKAALRSGEIEGAPYPCRWEEKKNGSYVITVEGEVPASARWSILSASGVFECVQDEGTAVFTLTSVAEGSAALQLRMREANLPVERGADFRFQLTVDEKKNMSIDSAEAQSVDCESFVAESGASVYWTENGSGGLFLSLPGSYWSVEASEGVSRLGPTEQAEGTKLELMAEGESEQRTITLRNDESGEGFFFVFTLQDSALAVESCTALQSAVEETEALSPELQAVYDAYNAAKSESEKNAVLEQYNAALEQQKQEEKDRELAEQWKKAFGREPTEAELASFKAQFYGVS